MHQFEVVRKLVLHLEAGDAEVASEGSVVAVVFEVGAHSPAGGVGFGA